MNLVEKALKKRPKKDIIKSMLVMTDAILVINGKIEFLKGPTFYSKVVQEGCLDSIKEWSDKAMHEIEEIVKNEIKKEKYETR